MDNQVGHVSNQVGLEAEDEEHVEDAEQHLSRVHRMEIAIADAR